MRLLCASSLAFVHSLRIALEGEDIETYCSDADMVMANITGPLTAGAARLYVLHDEDWDRALAVMHNLSPPTERKPRAVPQNQSALSKWVFIGVSALAVVLLAGLLGN
jgi:hypothetical protein